MLGLLLLVCLSAFSQVAFAAVKEKTPAVDVVPIKKNAELVIKIAGTELGKDIGYDRAGVEWLDKFIQGQYERGEKDHDKLVQVLGSYLGEVIIHNYGGEWAVNDHGLGVRWGKDSWVFPFAKVAKQLNNGAEDSVLALYNVIPAVLKLDKPDKK